MNKWGRAGARVGRTGASKEYGHNSGEGFSFSCESLWGLACYFTIVEERGDRLSDISLL